MRSFKIEKKNLPQICVIVKFSLLLFLFDLVFGRSGATILGLELGSHGLQLVFVIGSEWVERAGDVCQPLPLSTLELVFGVSYQVQPRI